jgi:hypothetical protein
MLPQKYINIIFLSVCIVIRSLFVYIAKTIDKKHLPKLGYIALVMGAGFLYTYFINRKIGSFGQKAWWNYLRPVHSFLYISFGILAIQKNSNAYIPLLIDVIIGLIAFIHKRFI